MYQSIAIAIYAIPTIFTAYMGIQTPKVERAEIKTEQVVEVEAEPPSTPKTVKEIAQQKIEARFGQGQWEAFDKLVTKESGWNPLAQNPSSTAYGLCQFLNSTWKNGKTSDPEKQLDECVTYIADRYETPTEAWSFHQKNNWY